MLSPFNSSDGNRIAEMHKAEFSAGDYLPVNVTERQMFERFTIHNSEKRTYDLNPGAWVLLYEATVATDTSEWFKTKMNGLIIVEKFLIDEEGRCEDVSKKIPGRTQR